MENYYNHETNELRINGHKYKGRYIEETFSEITGERVSYKIVFSLPYCWFIKCGWSYCGEPEQFEWFAGGAKSHQREIRKKLKKYYNEIDFLEVAREAVKHGINI